MANPVINAVRRSLGRTEGSPLGARPDVYPPRQPGSPEEEIEILLRVMQRVARRSFHALQCTEQGDVPRWPLGRFGGGPLG